MNIRKRITAYFSTFEIILWTTSVFSIFLSFFLFDRGSTLTLIASLLGVSAILLNAKGNPLGQALMVAFSLLYGYISFSFAYYGEMATYLGMSMPMAIIALISWLRHPFKGKRSEVEVNRLEPKEALLLIPLTIAVTLLFYFILSALHTANLLPSTLSVTTSFIAVWLTFRRSPYFSLAYACNDVVLILLWTLAATKQASYISVVVCFLAFLANDIYAFISWKRMERRQNAASSSQTASM